MRQLGRVAATHGLAHATAAGLRAKDLDHADHRAQQAQQGRGRGDGGQCRQVFFQPVRHGAPRAFHGGTQVGLAALGVAVEGAQAAGQHFAQGGVLRQLVHHVGGGHGLGRDRDGFIEQFRGGDTGRLEGHETFKNQRHSQDGTRNQGPDRPACGLYDGQQISLRADESNRRLWPSLQGPPRHKPLRCCARRRPICSPTKSVDNFVGNHCSRPRKVAPRRACNRLMKNCAMKKLYKSITCTCSGVLRAVFSYVAVVTAAGQILWSTCAVRAAQTPAVSHV